MTMIKDDSPLLRQSYSVPSQIWPLSPCKRFDGRQSFDTRALVALSGGQMASSLAID